MEPHLVLIGADKGGVGKTMVSRVFIDYAASKGINPQIFDSEGGLSRYFPDAIKVDIETVPGKMQIFDSVPTSDLTVVDMRAAVLSKTLQDMRHAGLLDPVDRGNIKLWVLHVLGSSHQSLDEVLETNKQLGDGGAHVLIENKTSGESDFFKWDSAARNKFFAGWQGPHNYHFEFPHLDARAAEDVDKAAQTFDAYIKNTDKRNSDYLTRVVRHWRKQIFAKFDELRIDLKK